MTPRDNFISCIEMKEHEYVPSFIFDTSFGMSILGKDVSELYKNGFDPELSAKSISAGRRYLRHDGMNGATACGNTSVFGAKICYYDNRPPMVIRNAFYNPALLYDHEPGEVEGITEGLVISNRLLRGLEPDAFISAYTPSPFLLATVLRGVEPMILEIVSNEDYVHDLLRFTREAVRIMIDMVCPEDSCDAMMIPGAYDNADLLGLDSLRKFCLSDLRDMGKKARSYGLPTIFHPHGVLTSGQGLDVLNDFIGSGFECIYYGEGNDHRKICELTEGKCSVMGGIDTFRSIFIGPDERAVADTQEILDDTKGYNHVFTCSCSVDADLDRNRLKLMIDTVKKCGGPGRD